ncbi:hypothetical protein [Dokdonella sp.]|uniref:hypothetical protein n=1 Tax=Dokdonella sp. TaxID=2291710 RepID=UPI002F40D73D
MRKSVRSFALGVLVVAGMALAPAAIARSHWNVGIGIGLPGLSIGYSDCHHCGRGWGGNYSYAGGYYGGGYYGSYYAPVYYGPSYYAADYYSPSYYEPSYYPGYYSVRYYDRPSHRYYGGHGRRDHDGGHRHRDRDDYGHRASYYDRDGYYRH